MISEKSDKVHVRLIIALSSCNMAICKYQNSPCALYMLPHCPLLFLSSLTKQWFILHNQVTPFPFNMKLSLSIFLGKSGKTIRDLQSGNMSLISLCPSCSARLSVLSEIFEQLPVLLGWFLNVSYSGPCNPPSTCLVMVTTLVSLDLDYLLLNHWCSTDHSFLKKPCIYQTFLFGI